MPRGPPGALMDLQGGERAIGGTRSGFARSISLKSGSATFMESSKYSFFIPHVPSTAEHRSITSTDAPVRRSTSAERVPMFWALRWQGS
jgi:hypothetical protein